MAFAKNAIPFSEFARLIEELSKVKPRRAEQAQESTANHGATSLHFERVADWISHWKRVFPVGGQAGDGNDRRLPEGTVRIFLRLLFPEEGTRRRYVLLSHTSQSSARRQS